MIVSAGCDVTKIYSGFLTMPYEKTNNLFYGVELECYQFGESGSIKQVKSFLNLEYAIYGHAIIKPDCGCEIVTVPATLRYHKEVLWNKFFNGVHKGFKGATGAGLHIHVSRNAMTPLQLAKVICFMNEPVNSQFLANIGGRPVVGEGSGWCQQKQNIPRNVDAMLAATYSSKSNAMQISGRNSGNTAELRIFQSNPTQQGVFQALEFLDAMIKYCAKYGDLEKEISYKAFVAWFVEGNFKNEYPYLYNNLVRLSYITPVKDKIQEVCTAVIGRVSKAKKAKAA